MHLFGWIHKRWKLGWERIAYNGGGGGMPLDTPLCLVYIYIYIYLLIDLFIECKYIYIYINQRCYKFCHVETHIFGKNNYFCQTLANPMFIFSATCCPTLVREKPLTCDILKFVPGVSPPCHTSFRGSYT